MSIETDLLLLWDFPSSNAIKSIFVTVKVDPLLRTLVPIFSISSDRLAQPPLIVVQEFK